MRLAERRSVLALVLSTGTLAGAAGIDVPLSREDFEGAWRRGTETKPGEVVERYHLGTRRLGTGTIDIYLSTPYARILYVASKEGKNLDPTTQEARQARLGEVKSTYLVVTSVGSLETGAPRKDEPSIQRAAVRKPVVTTGKPHIPLAQGRVEKDPDDYSRSLGMNRGWLFEFDPTLFSGDEDIEVIVETTRHRAVIPVGRGKLLALPENEGHSDPEPR